MPKATSGETPHWLKRAAEAMAQRDHLIAAVNIPILAITALRGAVVAMAQHSPL
jgi:hypothetical protein